MNSSNYLFKEEALGCISKYPRLKYVEEKEGIPTIQGELILKNDQGEEIDSYKIRIVCSQDYPFSFPKVFETGGRIPPNIEWHVHTDRHACICTWPEELILCSQGIKLSYFIEGQVIPYFFNQKHRETFGFFFNERAHGIRGNLDFFKEEFRTNDLQLVFHCLQYIKRNKEPNRVHECFCGSGKKYRKCHREEFRKFKALPFEMIDRFIKFIKSSEPNLLLEL
ncbi:SEC-C metal-binding domain-containing protein [Aquiflexum sp.]|uniref:SEC-C metal-binding domain-containing protein n=1 Tax=Aquiflexum sp. TaxID=1872584 RepID=UPI0035932EBD